MKFLHKYMRAIGFSEYADRKKMKEVLTFVATCINLEGIMLGEKEVKQRKTNMVRPHPYVESKKQKPHRNRE